MNTRWLLAKYMPDLRKREPRNVGVVLFHEGKTYARFRAEKPDGSIDGRTARGFTGSQENYKAWVRRWRHDAEKASTLETFEAMARPLAASNYFLEPSGFVEYGDAKDPDRLLDYLFTEVITQDTVRNDTASVRVSEVFAEAGILEQVEDDPSVFVDDDHLFFDHRYSNGVDNYFRRLAPRDTSSGWDAVHAACWAAARLTDAAPKLAKRARVIALVQDTVDEESSRLLRPLVKANGLVLDVSKERAGHQLRALLDTPIAAIH